MQTDTHAEALKPCPFCGGSGPLPYGLADGRETVLCADCAANGPSETTSGEAIAAWNRRAAPAAPASVQVPAWRDVLAERERQKAVEGWTPEHDDTHRSNEMAIAAACYALNASDDSDGPQVRFVGAELWPWADEWWKPTEPRRDLVKAGALILAEIERLDRLPAAPLPEGRG